MAIQFLSSSTKTVDTPATIINASVNVHGDAGLVLFFVGLAVPGVEIASNTLPRSITYGGNTVVLETATPPFMTVSRKYRLLVGRQAAPPTGDNIFSIIYPSIESKTVQVVALSYGDVNISDPYGVDARGVNSDDPTDIQVTITGSTSGLVDGALWVSEISGPQPSGTQTGRSSVFTTTNEDWGISTSDRDTVVSGSISMEWETFNRQHGHIASEIKE